VIAVGPAKAGHYIQAGPAKAGHYINAGPTKAGHYGPSDVASGFSRTDARPSKPVRQLRSDLDRVFNAPIMARGVWCVDIRSLDTGEVLYQRDPGRLMMPASNMKIVTLAAAARVLGWDYRFKTTLETTAPIEGGILKGDLFVRGSGDPTINSRDGRAGALVTEWVTALHAAGIQQIDGRIIGDDQRFDDEGIGPGWAWDYLQYGYAAPVGALQFNEDLATLTIAPAAQPGVPAVVSLTPGSGLTLLTRVSTGASDSTTEVNYRRRLDDPVLEVTGAIAAGSQPTERTVAVVNPTMFFAQALKDSLIEHGVPVTGQAVDLDDVAAALVTNTADRRVLASSDSPPLRAIATVLMKVSQNLYAETLLKAIGAARGGLGTFEGGLAAVRAELTAMGVPEDGYILVDGSGLSRYNYLAPSTITLILEKMYQDERHHDPFLATLPIAGKDGTISTRLRHTRAEGNALAKTGSISNARSLSGYLRTRDGEMLVFSILANDFVIPAATVNWIADLAVEHLSNFTRKQR
jgi:D-alanyl-D-alanine carboxypeptidase/D-alanyl-D-alanine-endopeptidase (penicillin-binding protein 4)